MGTRKHFVLPALASFAYVITPLLRKKDDLLKVVLDNARAEVVRDQFHDEANEILHRLQGEHDVYINLRAFIELKGHLTPGRSSRRASHYKEMLEDDELLAEREYLRGEDNGKAAEAFKLVAAQPEVVLLGDAGAGKTTVAREWEYRLAQSVTERSCVPASPPEGTTGSNRVELLLTPRLPVVIRASAVEAGLYKWKKDDPKSAANVINVRSEKSSYWLAIGAFHVIVDALNELNDKQRERVAEWIVSLRRTFEQTPVVVCHREYSYIPGLLPFPVVLLER